MANFEIRLEDVMIVLSLTILCIFVFVLIECSQMGLIR